MQVNMFGKMTYENAIFSKQLIWSADEWWLCTSI